MLQVERFPYSISGLPYAICLDKLSGHRREHVIVCVDVLESLARKLALHGERNQKLLSHQAQTGALHRPFVAKELHTHWASLPDAPGAAARLTQRMERVSRLVEEDSWKVQEI